METTRQYEIAFWIKKNDEHDLCEGVVELLTGEIIARGGSVTKEPKLLKRRLAYPVKKEIEGFWGTCAATMKPEDARSLEDKFKREDRILRLGIFLLPEFKAKSRAPLRRERKPAAAPRKKTSSSLEELEKKLEEILKT